MTDRRTYRFDNEKDVEELSKMLMEDSEDELLNEEFGDESEDEEDGLEEREKDFETEEEASSEGSDIENGEKFIGKDGSTKWFKKKRFYKIRKQQHNIITHLPGVKQPARNITGIYNTWKCLFEDSMLDIIVTYTNLYIDKI